MRKAELSGTLIGIIAAVAAGLVIIGVLIPTIINAKGSQAESLCKTSVAIRAGTAVKAGSVELQTSPLLCKTLTSKIKEDQEKVSREIANRMAKCWNMFGAGAYENSVFDTLNIFGGGKGCFTCYVLAVEETRGFKEGTDNIPAQELVDFLRTAKYPANSDQTYLQYFQTAGGPGNVLNLLTARGIEPNHAYAVSYKAGTGTCTKCAEWGGSAVASAGVVLFLIPTGITQAVGALTYVAGIAAAGYNIINVETNNLFAEAAIDTLILSDITSAQMNAQVRQSCNFVEDIEGKKLK